MATVDPRQVDRYREQYPHFAVTVDVVPFLVRDRQLQVVLIRWGEEPGRGQLALPGGFKRPFETLDEAAARELQEETGLGLSPSRLRQFRAYGNPGRDPAREALGVSVVTVAYMGIIPAGDLEKAVRGTDAAELVPMAIEDVLNGPDQLAFDHHSIIREVYVALRDDLGNSPLATAFLPEVFTLSDLRSVYESIWGVRLDPGNFQGQFIPATRGADATAPDVGPWLVADRRQLPEEAGRGRPAMRYRRSPRWRVGCPVSKPLVRLGNVLAERRILWLDPHPENNRYALSLLSEAALESEQLAPTVLRVATADEALAVLGGATYDLVLTHWGAGVGHDESGSAVPAAVQLLEGLRDRGIEVPVIVFAASVDPARGEHALALGAVTYCSDFDDLFRVIERTLVQSR